MALHIIDEAERCLTCKKPLCQAGCPVSTDIPQAIRLFRERKMDECGKLLFENNPMSAMCALVCNHGAQCEGHCVLGRKGTPVHFSAIEHYVSTTYLDRLRVERPEKNGKRAAVIGGGPAGLVAALKLAQAGVDVTLFDAKPRLGGVMRYGIPPFRLPKDTLDRYQEILEAWGVKIRHNTTIGVSLTIPDLFRDGYDSVLIGTGTWRAQTLGIKGEAGGNVLFGLDYLRSPQTAEVGERVAIIGAGNTGMDVARTVFREGAHEVRIYSRTRTVNASSDELEFALLDGAEIVQGKHIQYITETGPVFKTALFDDEDNIIGYEDELDQVECDTVIVCISQKPRSKLLKTTPGLESCDRGTLVVDDHYMCTVPGVFAAGDVVTGPNTVVHAVEAAKKAVEGMLAYMGVKR